jgi:hypothetical protein
MKKKKKREIKLCFFVMVGYVDLDDGRRKKGVLVDEGDLFASKKKTDISDVNIWGSERMDEKREGKKK